MAATDHFSSLDSTLSRIRAEHDTAMHEMEQRLFVAQSEAAMYKDAMNKAMTDRASADRVVTKLLAQFGMVSAVFEQAKIAALAAGFSSDPITGELREPAKTAESEGEKAVAAEVATSSFISVLPINQLKRG